MENESTCPPAPQVMPVQIQPVLAQPLPTQIQPPKIIYINFYDGINESKVKTLMGMLSQIVATNKPETLYFLFSSPGGSVDAGIVLYNFLRALPVEIVMHNTGTIASIGTVIYMAGSKRYAAPQSTFLFHGVQTMFPAGAPMSHAQLVERLSMVRQDENKIAGIIASRSSLVGEDIRKLFHQGESKDLAFAEEKGIIHEIREPNIPKDAPFITVNLN